MATIYVSASGSDSNDGTIGSPMLTPRAAQTAAGSNGKVLLKTGECFGPSTGGLFFYISTISGLEIGTYGTASDKPILDALTYQNPGVGGWTYVNSGVWKKVFSTAYWVRRLWVGSTSLGNLVSQRVIGTAKRRATGSGMTSPSSNPAESAIIAALSSTDIWYGGGAATSYALYVYTGTAASDPPTYYGGLAFIQSDGVSVGAVEGLRIHGRSGVYCHDIHFRGNGATGIRLATNNTATGDCYDNLIEDCIVTCPYNGALLSATEAQASPLYRCRSSTFRRIYCDYTSHQDEMEPDTSYSYLSGISDLYNVSSGSVGITIENCYGLNGAHNGISVGSVAMNTMPPMGTRILDNTIKYDSWHTYARGCCNFDGDALFRGNTFDGQNTRTQLAGSPRLVGNLWLNMRNSIRKPNVAQWVACESYVFDSFVTTIGTARYLKIEPINVVVENNTAYLAPDSVDAAVGLHFYSNGVGSNDNSFNAGTVTIRNNVLKGLPAKFVQTYEEASRVVGQQTFKNNCVHNGLTGDNKFLWRGTNYAINAAPGSTGNLEGDPRLGSDHRLLSDSPCIGAGVFSILQRGFDHKYFQIPPSIGAHEYIRPRDSRV